MAYTRKPQWARELETRMAQLPAEPGKRVGAKPENVSRDEHMSRVAKLTRLLKKLF